MKKKCYLCLKTTTQIITNREIRGKVKCKVFKCLVCELEYLDRNFVKVFLTVFGNRPYEAALGVGGGRGPKWKPKLGHLGSKTVHFATQIEIGVRIRAPFVD